MFTLVECLYIYQSLVVVKEKGCSSWPILANLQGKKPGTAAGQPLRVTRPRGSNATRGQRRRRVVAFAGRACVRSSLSAPAHLISLFKISN